MIVIIIIIIRIIIIRIIIISTNTTIIDSINSIFIVDISVRSSSSSKSICNVKIKKSVVDVNFITTII